MRIAVVHSFYSSRVPSGENQVVLAQVAALREAGHDVALVSRSTDDRLRRPTYPVEAALTTVTGVGPEPVEELRAFRPDVVHVHNLFPNLGTRWLGRWRGALVVTVHNFRPMCATGYLYRDGATCTACPDGDPWAGVRHGCFHGSRVATLPLAWRGRHGAAADPLVRRADVLVTLSARARDVYVRAGVPEDRLEVVPNFVADSASVPVHRDPEKRFLCVGRLTPEKGVLDLVRSWPADVDLDIVGDGALADDIRTVAPAGVRLLGSLDNTDLRDRMPGYAGLVIPSKWFEGLPTVYLEALAAGVPVICFPGNSAADDVATHGLGVVTGPSPDTDEVAQALLRVLAAGPPLRDRARASFTERFTAATWLRSITAVYETAASSVTLPTSRPASR
ncbi:glycosyltransferase family 4 protein [Actinomycetospora flava]|uniref:Glycosyltransferase family 4 protein n=1 Tax=Actinomycetospora flava TaxID=3129232 RepID=A0ABU8M5R1_9PSEU